MANKNNDLKYKKRLTLENSDDAFKEIAEKVERISPIGWTSGLGNENYYFAEGLAYDSYKEAVNDIAERNGITQIKKQ